MDVTANKSETRSLLVMGATGFLGKQVCRAAKARGWRVVASGRRRVADPDQWADQYVQMDLAQPLDDDGLLRGIHSVVFCAGIAHQRFGGVAGGDLERINVEAAVDLYRKSEERGVSRFVLISSISVYGPSKEIVDETSPCNPTDIYAKSKLRAEQRLREAVASGTGRTRLTLLRVPTLFGHGDPGNIGRLIETVGSGRFLQIGAGRNTKSLAHVQDAAAASVAVLEGDFDGGVELLNAPVRRYRIHEILGAIRKHRCKRWLGGYIPSRAVTLPLRMAVAASFRATLLTRAEKTLSAWLSDNRVCDDRFVTRYGIQAGRSLEDYLGEDPDVGGVPQSTRPTVCSGGRRKRACDIVLSSAALLFFALPMLFIAALIKATSRGPVLHVSERVGRNNTVFRMLKFRSMRIDTPQVATHLLAEPGRWTTPVGRFLRRTSLDELPQLWNILIGEMSFVGPRPALYNQHDLIALRSRSGIDALVPGLTGWAQVNGRDELEIPEKVKYDEFYAANQSFSLDTRILLMTYLKAISGEGIRTDTEPRVEEGATEVRSRQVA